MKTHFDNSGIPQCRPAFSYRDKVVKYQMSKDLTKLTCKHCMKALGLNAVRVGMTAKKATAFLSLDGKTIKVPIENFEMKILHSPALVIEEPPPINNLKEYLMPEPPPIELKLKMTEEGAEILREAVYAMPLRA